MSPRFIVDISGEREKRDIYLHMITGALIFTYAVDGDVVFFKMNVSTSFESFMIKKRYTQFAELYVALQQSFPEIKLPSLPEKHLKLIIDHTSPEFAFKRQTALNQFVQDLLAIREIENSDALIEFFTSDRIKV